jgi:hypothetical protein
MLTVSIGHRVSMGLKLAEYQRDALKALFLAKAGINRAINAVDSDKNGFDALNEPWVNNEGVFKKISFGGKEDEFASVSYTASEGGISKDIFGAKDEESRINLQLASKNMLKALGADCFSDAAQLDRLADYIQLWRGRADNQGAPLPSLGDKDQDFKKSAFSNPEELLVVLEYFFRDNGYADFRNKARNFFNCLQDKLTVWGDGKLNINTASAPVITVFLKGLAEGNAEAERAGPLAEELVASRERNLAQNPAQAPFKRAEDLSTADAGNAPLLDKLKTEVSFSASKYFCIRASGNCAKVRREISVVYDRSEKKIVYWHED